jgi:starch synthase
LPTISVQIFSCTRTRPICVFDGFSYARCRLSRFPGIDLDEWNPAADPYLDEKLGYKAFSKTSPENKAACKKALQAELGLQQNDNVPLVCFIGRLAPQKGVDLIEEIFPWLLGHDPKGVTGDVQLVMMGSGEERYSNFLRRAELENKGKVNPQRKNNQNRETRN